MGTLARRFLEQVRVPILQTSNLKPCASAWIFHLLVEGTRLPTTDLDLDGAEVVRLRSACHRIGHTRRHGPGRGSRRGRRRRQSRCGLGVDAGVKGNPGYQHRRLGRWVATMLEVNTTPGTDIITFDIPCGSLLRAARERLFYLITSKCSLEPL